MVLEKNLVVCLCSLFEQSLACVCVYKKLVVSYTKVKKLWMVRSTCDSCLPILNTFKVNGHKSVFIHMFLQRETLLWPYWHHWMTKSCKNKSILIEKTLLLGEQILLQVASHWKRRHKKGIVASPKVYHSL